MQRGQWCGVPRQSKRLGRGGVIQDLGRTLSPLPKEDKIPVEKASGLLPRIPYLLCKSYIVK